MLAYTVAASINPDEHWLSAEATVKLPTALIEGGYFKFCLHKDLIIAELSGANLCGNTLGEPELLFSPDARVIKLQFSAQALSEPVQEIRFVYRGKLGITGCYENNRISPSWTELGLYTPWYPLSVPMQQAVFSVQLHLPSHYSLISSGQAVKKDGYWLIEQTVPSLDCTLVVAPQLHVKQTGENSAVRASYTETAAEPAAAVFSRIGAEVMDWFSAKFGPAEISPINIVIAPRLEGGGYARPGFVMLTADASLDDETVLYRYIGHEFAHLWWYRADTATWEDWLNESLAEFSSLLAMRNLLGRETYARFLAVRREKAKNLPAIRGISRDDERAHAVLYCKGCVFLADLEAQVGEAKFAALLQELVRRRTAETAEFLAVLAEVAGKQWAEDFSTKLDN